MQLFELLIADRPAGGFNRSGINGTGLTGLFQGPIVVTAFLDRLHQY